MPPEVHWHFPQNPHPSCSLMPCPESWSSQHSWGSWALCTHKHTHYIPLHSLGSHTSLPPGPKVFHHLQESNSQNLQLLQGKILPGSAEIHASSDRSQVPQGQGPLLFSFVYLVSTSYRPGAVVDVRTHWGWCGPAHNAATAGALRYPSAPPFYRKPLEPLTALQLNG